MLSSPAELEAVVSALREQASAANSDEEVRAVIARIARITRQFRVQHGIGIPADPITQAREIDPSFTIRPHLAHLGVRIANAVRDVERGQNRMLAISMPPRMGKTTGISIFTPLWLLRRHPEWKIALTSHDGDLTAGWARAVRRMIEEHPDLGIAIAKDGGAGARWSTVENGGIYSTSLPRGSFTGRGARVLVIDDPIKDFVEAHSPVLRQNLWDWWLSVALTRLEPPYLVLVVMTRWNEDDFVGRLLSPDHEGDPRQWEKISLPALAEPDDAIGRPEGAPLLSPLLRETEAQALDRWDDVARSVGTYTFASMYQQRPAPAKGAIFDTGWWRFWSFDPAKATEDGRVVYLDPSALTGGRWLDSWDLNFESDENTAGGWVVGQRWVRNQANRYLVAQTRGRWTFTQQIARLRQWGLTDDSFLSPFGGFVHLRLIEKKANGAAAINVLREEIAGIKPTNPTASKEIRARAVTPEIESGNVYLPHPSDPGNEWVQADLLPELRDFPHGVADDQVDTLSQALSELRDAGRGKITVPGRSSVNNPRWQVPRDPAAAARTDLNRRRPGR